jgi:prophage regulatory protein
MTDLLNDRLLKLAQVIEITGLSKAMVYRLVGQAKFPKPCKPGGSASRWAESEVRTWHTTIKADRELSG